MKRLLSIAVLFALSGCDTQGQGQRCNPLRATSDCDPGFSCIYPTAPSCGVSYCCAVDSNGNVTDTNPNCQSDPSLASTCMVDLSVAPTDGGSTD